MDGERAEQIVDWENGTRVVYNNDANRAHSKKV